MFLPSLERRYQVQPRVVCWQGLGNTIHSAEVTIQYTEMYFNTVITVKY